LNRAAREALIYGLLLGASVLINLLIRAYGERLPMPTRAAVEIGPPWAWISSGRRCSVY